MKKRHPQSRARKFEWKPNPAYRHADPPLIEAAKMLKKTRSMAVVSSFLLADDAVEEALVGASDSGARCYILTAAAGRLQNAVGTEFEEVARKRHVEMLNNLKGRTLVRSSDDFHAKIILVDPKSDDPKGMLLTANLTKAALGRNQELSVPLEKDEIREAMSVLKWAFWENSSHELAEDRLRDCKPLGKVGLARPEKILLTSPKYRTIREEITGMLDGNPKRVVISSFGWDAGHPVVEKLCKLAKRGTNVTVLTRANRDSVYPALEKMKKSNIRILGFEWLHAKALIADSHTMVMSANIEEQGFEKGFELGILLDGKRAEKIRKIVDRWTGNYEYEFINSRNPK